MVTKIGPRQPRRNFLKQWREHRGLTQEQLAARLDTHKGQISNWENGRRDLTFNVQAALAEALEIEPQDLFRDPAQPSADELLRRASPEVRDQALRVIRALVGDIENDGGSSPRRRRAN
jgi:transcriptional regulator with XRE-family HTH domain